MNSEPSSTTPLLRDTPNRDDSSTLGPASSAASISLEEGRRLRKRQDITRYASYVSAIFSCLCAGSITAYSLYGHLFQERLQYTQLQVNTVIICGELALYLPVALLGYFCDRFGPAPLSLLAAILFAGGYLLAAFTYDSGAEELGGLVYHKGWPLWVMAVAFVLIGLATTLMYLSAVTACAKNFGRGKYKGLALATPIAAFGLSGMLMSQIGSRIFYERRPDGTTGDVDVFRFFIFVAAMTFAAGIIGAFLLKIVDEDSLIDEAVDELIQSGLLEDSASFQRNNYGATEHRWHHEEGDATRLSEDHSKALADEEARKKAWLLKEETRMYLSDYTMWLLAAGFFFVSGSGECFITNLGTIIQTLNPPESHGQETTAATHVSIVALGSTIVRILTGTLTDVLAPPPAPTRPGLNNSVTSLPPRRRFTISRVAFLIAFGLLTSLGQVILASGLIQKHGERFWIISSLIGAGYGAIFSLTPVIIMVIWGPENFGTNWGIVAMVPAFSTALWGLIYSKVYEWAAVGTEMNGNESEDLLCYGTACYAPTFWTMAFTVWIACGLWVWAWKGRGGWSSRGISV